MECGEGGYLYVGAIGGHELFIDERSCLSHSTLRGVDAAPATNLKSKENDQGEFVL